METLLNQESVTDFIYNITSDLIRTKFVDFKKLNLIRTYKSSSHLDFINIYNFKYKNTNIIIKLQNVSSRSIYESHLEMKLGIYFNNICDNYYTHFSLFNYLKTKLKDLINFDFDIDDYILKGKCVLIPFYMISTYGFSWHKFMKLLNDFFKYKEERCGICCKSVPLYSPMTKSFNNFKLCNDECCLETFYHQYNPERGIKSYFTEMPVKGRLIMKLIKSIINSPRRDVVLDIPDFINNWGILIEYFDATSSTNCKGAFINYIELLCCNDDDSRSKGKLKILETDTCYIDYKLFVRHNVIYKFIKYFFYKLNKYDFLNCDINIPNCNIIETKYLTIEDETVFKKEVNDYAFHGSSLENWFNILDNGLQPGSKAKQTLVNANVYGKGIYVSDTPEYSVHYCDSRRDSAVRKKLDNKGNHMIMGIFQVAKRLETYKKSTNIYLVKDPKELILRYLVIINKGDNITKIVRSIKSKFSSATIKKIEVGKQSLAKKKGNVRLQKEWDGIVKKQEELNIVVKMADENIWNIDFSCVNLGTDTKIYKQLEEKEITHIQLEITIPDRYPFEAPFVRVVYPRFKFMTGHITRGGSICMELLTNKGWMPTMSIEMLLVQISNLITEGDAELDVTSWDSKYSIEEAKEAFSRMIKSHGW